MARGLAANASLSTLNLEANELRGSVSLLGAALLANSTLASLELNENRAGDAAGAELLRGLASNTGLTSLRMDECELCEQAGLAVAAALVANSTLRTLHLGNNQIGASSLVAVARSLGKNRRLEELDLTECGAGAAAAEAFALALQPAVPATAGNMHLRKLNLAENQCGTQAARLLREAFRQRAAALKPLAGTVGYIENSTTWSVTVAGASQVYKGVPSEGPEPPAAAVAAAPGVPLATAKKAVTLRTLVYADGDSDSDGGGDKDDDT